MIAIHRDVLSKTNAFPDSISDTAHFVDPSETKGGGNYWGCLLDAKLSDDEYVTGNAVVSRLQNLALSSISGYEEVADLAIGTHLKSFAEVIVRQRSAQQRALLEKIHNFSDCPENPEAASLAVLKSLWRLAILCLQRRNHSAFLEYVERAEAVLEEAYLAAAESIDDVELADEIRGYALSIYGARTICEELADNLSGGMKLSAEPEVFELEQTI